MGKKLFAYIAVIMMIAVPFACVAYDSGADAVTTINSDESVVIQTDKSFDDNKSELEKLGITSKDCYKYDDNKKCYVLTLENKEFRTTANVALALISTSDTVDFEINLKGENTICSGSTVKNEDYKYKSIAVLADHVSEKASVNDFHLTITGDGSLTAINNINDNDRNNFRNAYGINVKGTLEVRDEATVSATSDDIRYVYDGSDKTDELAISSIGILTTELHVEGGDGKYPVIFAEGGDADVCFNLVGELTEKINVWISSRGICIDKLYAKDCRIRTVGGDTAWYLGCEADKAMAYIISKSNGIGLPNGTKGDYLAYLENSKVIGIAGNATADDMATSVGITLRCNDGEAITINKSTVVGEGRNVACTRVGTSTEPDEIYAGSDGIACIGNTNITESLIDAVAGDIAYGPYVNQTYNCGLYAKGSISIDGSIVRAISDNGHVICYGIRTYDNAGDKFDITIKDSEVYAVGFSDSGTRKYNASLAISSNNGEVNVSSEGRRTFQSVAVDGTKKDIETPGQEKNIIIEYKFDVIFTGPYGIFDFERVTTDKYALKSYSGPLPDGKEFDAYYVDGEKVDVGKEFTIDEPLVVTCTYKDKVSSGDDWLAWTVAIILIALLIIAIVWSELVDRKRREQ